MSEQEEQPQEDLFSIKNIMEYFVTDYRELLIAVVLAPVAGYYMYRNKYTAIEIIIAAILPVIIAMVYLTYKYAPNPKRSYFLSIMFGKDPIQTGFTHKTTGDTWPFLGSAIIVLNGTQHVFLGGGKGQDDALLYYDVKQAKFINVIDKTNLSSKEATFSAVSFDVNGDGLHDLIVGRKDGVFLYQQTPQAHKAHKAQNAASYLFKKTKVSDSTDRVPLALSVSDYNHDGRADIYVSYFTPMKKYRGTIFNDIEHGRKNALLQGQSDGTFRDVTVEANAGGKPYNTFTAAFVDLNNDTWPDLALAHDSGEIELLENKKGKFISHTPYKYKGNWMGLAVGDYDNDGDQDLFFTNIGTDTKKDKLSVGDLKEGQLQTFQHVLLRNDGQFKFIEDNKALGIPGEGFGWGAIMADLNLDQKQELLFAENTKLFPRDHIFPKPGHYYESDKGRTFKYHNPHFGQTPLLADVNKDGVKDVIWVNMDGPVTAYLTSKPVDNYIIVDLPETTEFANATVIVHSGKRKLYQQVIQGGTGFGSDSSNTLQFGLGPLRKVDLVVVKTSVREYSIKSPKINSIVKLTTLRKQTPSTKNIK